MVTCWEIDRTEPSYKMLRHCHGRRKTFFQERINCGFFQGGPKGFFQRGQSWWIFILPTPKLRKRQFLLKS